ncbi:hypothetical protein BJ912DRAFT_925672 [Pholiota molesta]|nr:hypothetical protein BJ912DRAFT_925672 [Pholiota molesta]
MASPISVALSSYDKMSVLEVIKANPTWKTVDQLGDAFIEQANAKPYDVEKIATVIADLMNDPNVPPIKTVDFHRQPIEEPFKDILCQVVFDLIKRVFSDDIPAIEPTNPFLVSALISGACIRSDICNSSTQSGHITLGLRFEGVKWREIIPDEKAEVWAIHAALHLLAGGRRVYREEQIGDRQKELLPALKAIAEQNIIINPQGKALLQAAIAEAEAGFKKNLPIVDIWKMLFPEASL